MTPLKCTRAICTWTAAESCIQWFDSARVGLFCGPQNKMKELELLCSVKEVPLDCSDPEHAVMALRYEVKHMLTSAVNLRVSVFLHLRYQSKVWDWHLFFLFFCKNVTVKIFIML